MTEPDPQAGADYSNADRSCDIVMKGGITSGVVYPHAVCELAQTYRFRNVGGTSAGAIAAAATAAAEYGRPDGGFEKLAGLPDWLGTGSNLQDLFQPQAGTERLFKVLIAYLAKGWKRAVLVALWRYRVAAVAGALPALCLVALALTGSIMTSSKPLIELAAVASLLAGALLLLLGVAAAVVVHLAYEGTHAVPDNRFGLCSGLAGREGSGPALTEWLERRFADYSGLEERGCDEPLTFGHLWAGPGKAREQAPADPDQRWLQLAMMTTNLTNRRAHQLPWDSREWFFDPAELREIFPEKVVRWMVDHPAPTPSHYSKAKKQGSLMRRALMKPLLPFPAPEDLPVVVATRMSLSFPVLLSAIPLWNLDMSDPCNAVLDDWKAWAWAQGEDWDPLRTDRRNWPDGQPKTMPKAERCWFSDGGISSNFPIHFFDRLVPRWPTFAINLRPFPPWQPRDPEDEEANTWMVSRNGDGIAEWWYRYPEAGGFLDKRLFAFLSSAVRTMQNRVDERQMRVPGFRDRVAHVNMDHDEGGMNLTMPAPRIKALTARGRFAARRLLKAYGDDAAGDDAIGQPSMDSPAVFALGAGGDAQAVRRRIRQRAGAGRRGGANLRRAGDAPRGGPADQLQMEKRGSKRTRRRSDRGHQGGRWTGTCDGNGE
jgi:predicted acylesterase/phospholipase RssA